MFSRGECGWHDKSQPIDATHATDHGKAVVTASRPEGDGMFFRPLVSANAPYANATAFFGGRGRKPIVKRGSQSRTTAAEGIDLHKRGTSAEGWEEAANGRLLQSLTGGGFFSPRISANRLRRRRPLTALRPVAPGGGRGCRREATEAKRSPRARGRLDGDVPKAWVGWTRVVLMGKKIKYLPIHLTHIVPLQSIVRTLLMPRVLASE